MLNWGWGAKLAADVRTVTEEQRRKQLRPPPAVVCEAPRETQLFPWPVCDLRTETSTPQLLPNFPAFAPMMHATGVLGPWSPVDVNVIHWGTTVCAPPFPCTPASDPSL